MKRATFLLLLSLITTACTREERFSRIDDIMNDHVKKEQIAGAVALVAKDGVVSYHKAFGFQDRDDQIPMTPSSLFRIASMTKPITCAAVMILWDEGKFFLSDPVSKYIPEYETMTVRTRSENGDITERPAEKQITVKQLLTHTSGLSYHWNPVVGEDYAAAGIGHGLSADTSTTRADMTALASIPLVQEPGSHWHYGLNIDLLGYLVEIWSGMPFQDFLKTRIFAPLEMRDTRFTIPEEEKASLAAVYRPDESSNAVESDPTMTYSCGGGCSYQVDYPYRADKQFFAGGAGLISTAGDYFNFLKMMLRDGSYRGKRILSRKAVELMTRDQLASMDIEWQNGVGFGFGIGVHTDPVRSGEIFGEGTFFWGGFFYTTFWVDPRQDLIAVMMTQNYPNNHLSLRQQFRNAVYQSL